MALMSLFQGPSSLEKIKAKLAAKGREIHAAEARHRAAALEAALADDDAALAPLITEIAAMNAERQLLAGALAEAERLEQERIEAERTEEDRSRREAEAKARQAAYRGSVQHLARVNRGAEKAQTIITDLAEAVGEMCAGMASYHGLFGGAYPYRAFDIDGLIANELARAGRKHGVEIPGAVGDGGDPTLTAAIKNMVKVLSNRAEQMLVRGLPDPTMPPPEPSHGVKPATPEPPRRARLPHIECETLRMAGRDPLNLYFDPRAGRSFWREQLEAAGWKFDRDGNPIVYPELPVEAPAPPPGRVEPAPASATSKAAPEPPPPVHGVQLGAIYEMAKIGFTERLALGERPERPTHPEAAAAWDAVCTVRAQYEAEHGSEQNAVAAEPAVVPPVDEGAALSPAPSAAATAALEETY